MINIPSAEEMKQLSRYDLEKEMENLRDSIISRAKNGFSDLTIESYHSTYKPIMDNYDKIGPYLRDLGYTVNFTDNMSKIIIRWNE